jgi:hypothetical protein
VEYLENLRRNTHERLSAAQDIRGSSDRSFGIVMAIVFTIIGAWPLLSEGPPRWWAWIAAALFCSLAFLRPALLAPLNRLWFRFGLLLNKITSPLIMGLLFYGVMTPYAYILRWLGKDLLRLRFDPTAESYWFERKPPGPAPESIKRQF